MTTPLDGERSPGLATVAQRESMLLAPYALHSCETAGRCHPEPEHPYRGPFQRDRDRILHSAAFRRLSGKMQVFTGEMGDYHRTRLTHTFEVASIARTLGRALRLNEDLIEALALVHDIGHPPYGHAGEDALNACLMEDGGFCHNDYALTIVEELEQRYPDFPGLNLSREVLEGQSARTDKSPQHPRPPLEVQVVDVADSITYDAHDTDDALKLGILTPAQLADTPLIRETRNRLRKRHASLEGEMLRQALVHELIDFQVTDVLRTAAEDLARHDFPSSKAARRSEFMVGPSRELTERKTELEAFLYRSVYRHPQLVEVRHRAQQRLKTMFDGYLQRRDLLPEKFRRRRNRLGLRRCVGDYLAGMTDRFCDQQFTRHFAGGRG
jgi:dGTPase